MDNKTILISGGTGSFGQAFTEILFKHYKPKKLIIFSRDEFKQYEMAKKFPSKSIRYFIGDVRDKERLITAFEGVDYVVHAAALKHVPALEYNPTEAVKTNIDGANNIIHAALETKVKKVIALSSDKAVNPINLYGATKLVAEKLFLAANAYGGKKVKFSIVRYGNVINSRGSVIELFLKLTKEKCNIPITSLNMTRFWITLTQAVNLVIEAFNTKGNEIYIPKLPSMRMEDLAETICPDKYWNCMGIRKGEKMHETLDEGYTSDTNTKWLTKKQLMEAIYENRGNYPSKVEFYTISP